MKLLNISSSQHLHQAMNLKLQIQVKMFKLRTINWMMTNLSRLNQRLMKLQQLRLRASRMKSLKWTKQIAILKMILINWHLKRILQWMTQREPNL